MAAESKTLQSPGSNPSTACCQSLTRALGVNSMINECYGWMDNYKSGCYAPNTHKRRETPGAHEECVVLYQVPISNVKL